MRFFHSLPILLSAVLLASCVDTTGLSEDSSKVPHPLSNKNAVVRVVEYGDLQCPACKVAHDAVTKALLATYGKQIRFEFKHFPLRSIHRFAMDAAQAAECAADQGKFWDYLDIAYAKQEDLSKEALYDWAKDLKLNDDLFTRCLRSGIKKDTVLADYAEGLALKVQGTPTYFVDGKITPARELLQVVAEAVKDVGTKL